MENEAVAMSVAMAAALIGCGLAYLMMRRWRVKLWVLGFVVLGAGWAALYFFSGNRTDDMGLTMLLAAMFAVLPAAVGWAFGGIYGALRGRGKPA